MASGISGHLEADDYASMYESRSDLTTVQKQHFVEWFSGSALDSIWNEFVQTASSSGAMADSVDGGFEITTTTANNAGGGINFNLIRQFAHNGSVFIAVGKNSKTALNNGLFGLQSEQRSDGAGNDSVIWNMGNSRTYWWVRTNNGAGSQTDVDSSIAKDTAWHTLKLILGASDVEGFIDGVTETTNTTTLPTVKLNPTVGNQNDGSASALVTSVRYMECYNT